VDKAPDAFRTISEVAEELETPAHVLRFWESRFPQIKPVKRAGGRRYYRPADVALLAGIRQLLHTEGMTIRGVQKVLREQGVRHVASLGGADVDAFDLEGEAALDTTPAMPARETPVMGRVVPIDSLPRRPSEVRPAIPGFLHDVFPSTQPAALREPAHFPQGADPTPVAGETLGVDAGSEAAPDPAELPLSGPRDGDGGFLAFPSSRRGKPKPVGVGDPPAQARLPFDTEVPEAPHMWVEDESEPEAALHSLPSAPAEEGDSEADGAEHTPHAAPVKDGVAGVHAPHAPQAAPVEDEVAGVHALQSPSAAAVDGPVEGILFDEFGSGPAATHPEAALADLPPASTEGLLAGILAEEFGSAVMDEVSKAIAAAMAGPVESDLADAGRTEAKEAEVAPDDFEPFGAEPALSDPTDPGLGAPAHPEALRGGPLVPDLTGLATRLRALSGPISPKMRDELEELHSRLGLLHAQMVEAVRLRR
jgi:DNA-binding transcriptional MerR regulator